MPKDKESSGKYRFSDETLKTSREFGYAARAASVLKNALLPLVFGKYANTLHKRLQSRIIAVLNSGPVSQKGQRSLSDGNVALLTGLQFNPHTLFSTLAPAVFLHAAVSPASGEVHLRLSPVERNGFKWPERARAAHLDIQVVVIDVHALAVRSHALEPLVFPINGERWPKREASLPVGVMDDSLVMVVIGVSFLRTDGEGTDALISHHQRLHAACIVQAACVKDGKVVEFTASGKAGPRTPPVREVVAVKWTER